MPVPERAFAPFVQIDRNDPAAPSALSEGLPNVWRDPVRLLWALGLGAMFLLLAAIPAEVLNSTLEANAHRWRWLYAWALPLVNKVSTFVSTLPAWGSSAPVVIVLTSIAFGFAELDPGEVVIEILLDAIYAGNRRFEGLALAHHFLRFGLIVPQAGILGLAI